MEALELEGYQFGDKIGEGGMAAVYRGQQLSLARPVAIKVLNQQLHQHGQVFESFEREAVIIARLSHPNIIQVIDRGMTKEGTPFFVMEYVDGIELGKLLRGGTLPLQKKIDVCLQICRALSYAHKNGVIHRDIKPSNILVNKDFTIKVLDFGIAQFFEDAQHNQALDADDGERNEGDASEAGSVTGEVMGTINYMAPELQDPTVIADDKSDIYSLGVMLYEIFSGHNPTSAERQQKSENAPLPQAIAPTVLSCMRMDPQARPDLQAIQNQLLLFSRGSHLDKKRAARAKASVNNKKTFALLDILRETEHYAIYLFVEKNTGQQLVVKKFTNDDNGFVMGKKVAKLAHDNILRVHGSSKNNRTVIQVMDYAAGGNLQERMVRPWSVEQFLTLGIQLSSALSYAHSQHVLHGNLRPSNILFSDQLQSQITDFGLPHGEPQDDTRNKRRVIHSQAYRPQGEPLCPQSDVYSLGVIFYQLLLGQLPKFHNGKLDITRAMRRLPQDLQQLMQRMLEPDLSQRMASMQVVFNELEQLQGEMPTCANTSRVMPHAEEHQIKSSKAFWSAVALVVMVSAVAAIYFWPMG
ncbi:protein kinase domain-containing protein [Aurantivibrio plasticivorans]